MKHLILSLPLFLILQCGGSSPQTQNGDGSMSAFDGKLVGKWKSPGITLDIAEDGIATVTMPTPLGGGCVQTVHHKQKLTILGDGKLKIELVSGETEKTGCSDESQNFARRPFDDDETKETANMFNQEFAYRFEGEKLITTATVNGEKMDIPYEKAGE